MSLSRLRRKNWHNGERPLNRYAVRIAVRHSGGRLLLHENSRTVRTGASEPFETYQGASTADRGDLIVVLGEPNHHDDEEPTVIAEIALRSGEAIRGIK
jgi:hypothetical protein